MASKKLTDKYCFGARDNVKRLSAVVGKIKRTPTWERQSLGFTEFMVKVDVACAILESLLKQSPSP